MRGISLFSILVFCLLQVNGQSSEIINDFKKLGWVVGAWNRTNVKPGQSGNERWIKISATELNGFGLTMRAKDTISFEKLKLVVKDDNIFYVADVPENKEPVYFRLTEISDTSFSCENPDHDFPKKIIYQKEGSKLRATISGNGKSIDYLFEKVQ
jgi:hypothetical protein